MNDQDESTELWVEVIAAVEYLREGPRPGLTVWGALEEATRVWLAQDDHERGGSSAWSDPDPLRAAIELLFRQVGSAGAYGAVSISTIWMSALRMWLDRVSQDHNDGQRFGGLGWLVQGLTA